MSTAFSGGVVGVGAAMSAADAATQVGTATSVLAGGCGSGGWRRCGGGGWGGWGGGRWANWRHRMPRIKIIIINTNRNRNVQQRLEERHEMDHHEDNNQPTWQ
ncbi:hypothetical protein ACFPOI_41560 [Nonomuraea angiospora]|uniref:Uncharacterized protein n=1 Tax=Nonomuraea angiospora TaxID=46172 RepID=A0ABR9M4L3_9ACTN|nr:hypothetical protein [Nonomuraea angiospora]MBE1587515.1 hypothetical protein [Nonomuraea angiospora]